MKPVADFQDWGVYSNDTNSCWIASGPLKVENTKNGKPAQKEAEEVLYHSLSNGLSYKIGGGCILTLCPPMTITEQELNEAFEVIEAGIKQVS